MFIVMYHHLDAATKVKNPLREKGKNDFKVEGFRFSPVKENQHNNNKSDCGCLLLRKKQKLQELNLQML